MKKFEEYIKLVNEAEMAFSDINSDDNLLNLFKPIDKSPVELKDLSLEEIGKQGKLAEFLDQGNVVRFGMLKALYHDALAYKKKREYEKGIAKFALRIIPIILAPIFFPIWLISQILGATRALNKILIPTLNMEHKNYNSFLKSLIIKTMNLVEGDIRPFLGKDWFYDVFYVHDGLTKMVRQEYIYEFSLYICDEIMKKGDDQEVPHYWLDNEFRKWLNNKFELDFPTGKVMVRHKVKI